MDKSFRGKIFNQWLTDLQHLVIRYIGVKKSKMNEAVEKELNYLLDRRDMALEELRSEVYAATNHNTLLVRPNKFPWLDTFIKAAEGVIKKNPGGADYLIPVAENFHALCAGQILLAQKHKSTTIEREWLKKAAQFTELQSKLRELAQKRSDVFSSNGVNLDSSNLILNPDTKQTEEFNQKYFRPSLLPALNIRNLNDLIIKIHQNTPSQVVVPKDLMSSPLNTILNYYSLLREATAVTEGVGCGTVGMMRLPYPAAYNFLSAAYQKRLSYEEYIKSFKDISHINLIKLIKNKMEDSPNKKQYYVELELISPPGSFDYSFGIIDSIKEDGQYKIDNIETALEDYFCAPYHFWQHNAEMKVDIVYGSWTKLLAIRYPTVQSNYKKYIYIKGTDGNNYLFTFIKLTNGTDVEIGQFKQSDSGQWVPVNLSSYSNQRAAADFSGTWASTMGVLVMKQDGSSVTGIYPAVKPEGWGAQMKGKIEGKVSGNILTGSWSETRYPGQFASGKFRFRLLPDKNHFVGTRGSGNSFEGGKWGGPWDGHRIERSYVFSSADENLELSEQLTYKNYYNDRYGFTIKYPDILTKIKVSDNGDGAYLTDESGNVKLIVYGSNNVFNTTAKSAYIDALKKVPNASFKKQWGNWYVISWIKNNKIIYKREVVGMGSINTVIFEYPAAQKKLYDEFLQNLYIYFKTPGIDEAH